MFQQISTEDAKVLIDNNPDLTILDTRDEAAYHEAHLTHALHLARENLQTICEGLNKSTPVLVYCYHGNSSKAIAKLIASQGIEQVYSLEGGFESWREKYPTEMSK